jgi:hypothetical protein
MGCPNQKLHVAAAAALTANGLSHVAAKATEAAAPEAAEVLHHRRPPHSRQADARLRGYPRDRSPGWLRR